MKKHAEETHVLSSPILKNSSRHHHLQRIQGEKSLYIFLHWKNFILGAQKLLWDVFRSSVYNSKLLFGEEYWSMCEERAKVMFWDIWHFYIWRENFKFVDYTTDKIFVDQCATPSVNMFSLKACWVPGTRQVAGHENMMKVKIR